MFGGDAVGRILPPLRVNDMRREWGVFKRKLGAARGVWEQGGKCFFDTRKRLPGGSRFLVVVGGSIGVFGDGCQVSACSGWFGAWGGWENDF